MSVVWYPLMSFFAGSMEPWFSKLMTASVGTESFFAKAKTPPSQTDSYTAEPGARYYSCAVDEVTTAWVLNFQKTVPCNQEHKCACCLPVHLATRTARLAKSSWTNSFCHMNVENNSHPLRPCYVTENARNAGPQKTCRFQCTATVEQQQSEGLVSYRSSITSLSQRLIGTNCHWLHRHQEYDLQFVLALEEALVCSLPYRATPKANFLNLFEWLYKNLDDGIPDDF